MAIYVTKSKQYEDSADKALNVEKIIKFILAPNRSEMDGNEYGRQKGEIKWQIDDYVCVD